MKYLNKINEDGWLALFIIFATVVFVGFTGFIFLLDSFEYGVCVAVGNSHEECSK